MNRKRQRHEPRVIIAQGSGWALSPELNLGFWFVGAALVFAAHSREMADEEEAKARPIVQQF
jgi:hypothetical protein